MGIDRQKERDRELYCQDIDWFINIAASALGESGTLAGTIAALERGNATPVGDHEKVSDTQIGWCVGPGAAEKWRILIPIWRDLSGESKAALICHYSPRNDLPEVQRVRVTGVFDKLANAVLSLEPVDTLPRVIEACMNQKKQGRGGIIRAARKRAEDRVRQAHRSWYAFREVHRASAA